MIGKGYLLLTCVGAVLTAKSGPSSPQNSFDTSIFKTNIAPVFTAFYRNNSYQLDLSKVKKKAEFLANNDISTVLVGGIVGEGASLGLCNRKKLITEWTKVAPKYNLNVIVNIGELPTVQTIYYAQYCQKAGVDAVITTLPLFYLDDTAKGIVDSLMPVAKAAPSVCFFYEYVPYMTGGKVDAREIHVEFTKRVSNYCGMKATLCTCLQIRGEGLLKKNQICMVTNYVAIRAASALGFNSTVVPESSIFPEMVNEITDKASSGDLEGAGEVQDELNAIITEISDQRDGEYEFIDIAKLKYADSLVTGVDEGSTIPPIGDSTYQDKQDIEEILEKYGLID